MSICEKIQQLVMGGEAGELPVTQEASPVQRRRHVA
jgi:hypothetical protein